MNHDGHNPRAGNDLPLGADDRLTLLGIARDSIRHGLDFRVPMEVPAAVHPTLLKHRRATFVTLHLNNTLRGCVGSLDPSPLLGSVARNAFAAAFRDSRFSPLTRHEFPNLHIHISILSTPRAMDIDGEADLLSQLRPGIDGLILEEPPRRVTFLPQVWEMVSSPREFVTWLKSKGDWPADHWSPSMRAYRYTTMSVS